MGLLLMTPINNTRGIVDKRMRWEFKNTLQPSSLKRQSTNYNILSPSLHDLLELRDGYTFVVPNQKIPLNQLPALIMLGLLMC